MGLVKRRRGQLVAQSDNQYTDVHIVSAWSAGQYRLGRRMKGHEKVARSRIACCLYRYSPDNIGNSTFQLPSTHSITAAQQHRVLQIIRVYLVPWPCQGPVNKLWAKLRLSSLN